MWIRETSCGKPQNSDEIMKVFLRQKKHNEKFCGQRLEH